MDRGIAKPVFPFLQGGGEMGELTRKFNWSKTSLGPPNQWPQSLRTTVSILLNSRFPMFLFWGEDLLCFYNDAYRPSLGNEGKHPGALGKKGEEVWPEIWPVIKPLIDQVLGGGEATWSEDQLIPIYRNGKLEDVYWTFSYSPVSDESGHPAGVFVTCVETTGKVTNLQKLEESEERYRGLFQSVDQGFCVLQVLLNESDTPIDYRFLETNPSFEAQTGLVNAVGKTAKELVPDLENYWFELYGNVALTGDANRFTQWSTAMNRWFDIYAYRSGKPEERKVALLFTDITERKLADERLRKSEQNLRNTILQAPVAMCIFKGPEHVVEIANERMFQFWGKDGSALLGRPIFQGLPEVKGQGFEELLMSVFTTGKTVKAYSVPVKLPRAGSMESVFVDFVYEAYREENGGISGVLAVAIEVTEQVLARKKIEEAEERARLSIDAAELGTFDIDLLANKVVTSPRFDAIFNTNPSTKQNEYVGLIEKEDLPIREAAYKKAYETGALEYDVRVRWKDGSVHWVRAKGIMSFDAARRPVKLIGVVQDVTAQKRFAEELQKQVRQRTAELEAARASLLDVNNYLQNIINKFDSALASLVPVYDDGKIVDFYFRMTNLAYKAYSNLLPEEIQNKRVGDVFPGYYQTEAFEKYVETFETGKSNNWDLHYKHDGLDVHLQVSSDKMGDEVVVNFTDFTALKTLQLALQDKVEELEQSNEQLQQFAHVASHDLKEPVRKIRTFVSRLNAEFNNALPERARLYLEKIESAATRIYAMIDGVLLYSSLNAVKQGAEQVDLNVIVNEIQEDLEVIIQQKQAIITSDVLPVMEGSRVLLYQLFYNLINNSLKFTKPGCVPRITIQADLVTPDNMAPYAVIKVSDNGIGFDQRQAKNIFETFVRLNSKDQFEGTGLGLALCKKIAGRHGGTITADGKPGDGATFTVVLPLKQA